MKNFSILKNLATIAAMLCLTTFTSCENEDITITPNEPPKYVRAVERYEVTLSEDFLNLYDVVATIGNSETGVENIKLDSCVWKYYKIFDNTIPGKFTCDVIATVKNPLPELDPEKAQTVGYSFKAVSSSSLQLYDETGYMTSLVLDNGSQNINYSMAMGNKNNGEAGVEKVIKYVTVNKPEVVILKSSYTINN